MGLKDMTNDDYLLTRLEECNLHVTQFRDLVTSEPGMNQRVKNAAEDISTAMKNIAVEHKNYMSSPTTSSREYKENLMVQLDGINSKINSIENTIGPVPPKITGIMEEIKCKLSTVPFNSN
jgi:hypothetical protein